MGLVVSMNTADIQGMVTLDDILEENLFGEYTTEGWHPGQKRHFAPARKTAKRVGSSTCHHRAHAQPQTGLDLPTAGAPPKPSTA